MNNKIKITKINIVMSFKPFTEKKLRRKKLEFVPAPLSRNRSASKLSGSETLHKSIRIWLNQLLGEGDTNFMK